MHWNQKSHRDSYLREACGGDDAMRDSLLGLLRAHDRAGRFLEHREPAVPPSGGLGGKPAEPETPNLPPASPLTEQPGDRIGRYKLLEQIGEGGMGAVWMAEQEDPVRRRVALKIIKLGMDTRSVIARFEAERQALALMDHPNIARVFDGGVTGYPLPSDSPSPVGRERVAEGRVREHGEWRGAGGEGAAQSEIGNRKSEIPQGRPYFVMELVRGLPITGYCDEANLSTRQRLELFSQVCRAVQHAHQKGIIHRDLKPSNILVTEQDGRPVVKVIDFGIAKATEGRLTDKTLFTGFAQLIGTPTYMSPEQAGLGSLDIDTRSDTYSLGVVLYELPTGRPPFDAKELLKSGYEALLRTIRETDPVKPSTRVKQEQAARPGGQAKPEFVNPKSVIDPDLDWIVMKCLEKDRARRYETTNALSLDIERYLHDEPVLARSPSTGYRLRKFVRKHRGPMTAAAGFIVLLMAATAVSVGLALWANQERDRAEKAQRSEAAQRQAAEEERERAREAETEAKAVLTFFENKVLRAAGPKGRGGGQGRQVTLREALEAAEPEIAKSFGDRPRVEASVRRTLGNTYFELGDFESAIGQHERARSLLQMQLGPDHPETLTALHGLAIAYHDAGRLNDAQVLLERALEGAKAQLGPTHSRTLIIMHSLAWTYQTAGRLEEAHALLEQVRSKLDTQIGPDPLEPSMVMNSLGRLYSKLGQFELAIPLLEEALNLRTTRFGPGHPETAVALNNLAGTYVLAGRLTNSVTLLEAALKDLDLLLGRDHLETLGTMDNLGNAYLKSGLISKALPLLEESLQRRQTKLGSDHQRNVSTMNFLWQAYMKSDRLSDALRVIQQAVELSQAKLSPDHLHSLTR